MAYKRITIMDVSEIIRRWEDGQTITQISNMLGYDRKTVRKYLLTTRRDSTAGAKETIAEIPGRPAKKQKLLEPYLDEIIDLVTNKVNPIKPKTAFEVLCTRHNLSDKVSYSSFKRFVKTQSIFLSPDKSTCRIETVPAGQLQVDYCKAGLLHDPLTNKRKAVYAFIGTLSFSRHKYVEFVFRQNQKSFVNSHVKMFNFFGGIPKTIVIDNLKTGVIKPDLYDPKLNRAYLEMAEHYHCFIDPCRVASPKDKGKVERDVQTIREQFKKLLALNPHITLIEANNSIKGWLVNDYGRKKHGTTCISGTQY
ncbi:IS21 family transposase [candidate division KSB1 bacterium]